MVPIVAQRTRTRANIGTRGRDRTDADILCSCFCACKKKTYGFVWLVYRVRAHVNMTVRAQGSNSRAHRAPTHGQSTQRVSKVSSNKIAAALARPACVYRKKP